MTTQLTQTEIKEAIRLAEEWMENSEVAGPIEVIDDLVEGAKLLLAQLEAAQRERDKVWKRASLIVEGMRSISFAAYTKEEIINTLLIQIEAAAKKEGE